jgi:hypothetical protein
MEMKVMDGLNAHFFPKAEEVCKIIATCRRNGVAYFEMGGLKVDFYAPDAREARVVSPESLQVPNVGAPTTPVAEVPGKTIQAEAEFIEEQGIQTREEQIAELLITDPLLAEEMMESGDLIEGSTDGSTGDSE